MVLKKYGANLGKFTGSLSRIFMQITVAGVVLTTAAQIALRYIPGIKLYGIAELITLSGAYLYFVGISYVTYQKKHITVDLITWGAGEDSLFVRYSGLVSSLLTITVSLVYGYLAFRWCGIVVGMGQKSVDLGYPRIILVSSLGLGFACMIIFSIYHFVREIIDLKYLLQSRRAS